MGRLRWLHQIDRARVQAAIEEAERRTSGEICVSVSSFFIGDVEKAARRVFRRLGVAHTRDRNGVLIFVVPSRRRFVILGDEGIDRRVGREFWESVATRVAERFKAGDFTGGLLAGIEALREGLSIHFPYDPERDENELPDLHVPSPEGAGSR